MFYNIVNVYVSYIGYRAFYECSSLTEVVLPETLKHIDDEVL